MENEIMYIKLDDIIPNRFQPREVFDENALNELSESIRQHGVLQPILVRPVSNKYEIIAGERRYKASALAGLTKIPAIVKQMDDKQSSIVAFIENAQRRDVSAIEEARTAERILKANNMTQEDLSKELGISQSTLANKLRLLSLPMEIQEALLKNEISERHARSLLSLKDPVQQLEYLKKIKEKRMTVRELDSEIKNMNNSNGNIDNQTLSFDALLNNNVEKTNQVPETQLVNNNQYDFNSLINNKNVEEANSTQESVQKNNQFNFDSLLNNNKVEETNQVPETPQTNNNQYDFNSLINNNNVEETNQTQEIQPVNNNQYDFNSLINNSNVEEQNQTPEIQPLNNNQYDFNSLINNNNVEETNQTQEIQPLNNNQYDFNSLINNSNVEEQNQTPEIQPVDNNKFTFENLLNNNVNDMNKNNQTSSVDNKVEDDKDISTNTINNQGTTKFDNFLSNYDLGANDNSLNDSLFNSKKEVSEENDMNQYLNNKISDNVISSVNINNDITPPISSSMDVNGYVEDNPLYKDASIPTTLDSIDSIIDELKVVVDKIKKESIYKIDTDEIDFDDMYQITIKVDKRMKI